MVADKFPIAAMHRGIRFHLGSQRDTMRLLLIMVRDHVCTVEDAIACFNFDDDQKAPQSNLGESDG